MIVYSYNKDEVVKDTHHISKLSAIIAYHLKMKARLHLEDFNIKMYGYSPEYFFGDIFLDSVTNKEDMKLTLDFANKTFHFVNTENIPFKDIINRLEQILGEDYLEWSTSEIGHSWSTGSMNWTTQVQDWTSPNLFVPDSPPIVRYRDMNTSLTDITL